MTDPDTQLVIIRHGESNANVSGLLSGHDTCTGLSDLGKQQAAQLRDRLTRTRELQSTDVIHTSILPRAIETAAIISPALSGPMPREECDWCEIYAGEAEGPTYEEFQERFPALGQPDDPFLRRMPGGETWAEFSARVGTRLQRVAQEHPGERVVVVGTLGPSRALLRCAGARGA